MIKREFWEQIAEVWSKKEEIYIPQITDVPDDPADTFSLEDAGDMDDLLKDLLSSDSDDDFDLDDFIF